MAGELARKVRLVRCPKCKLVLPELPDFDVYKCGGCGATLIAKHRVNIARSTESDPNNAEAVRENQSNRAREEKEEHFSSNKDAVPCSGQCSLSQNDESDQSKSGDCDGVNLTTKDTDNGIRRISDTSDFDNEGSEISSEVFSPTEFFDDKSEDYTPNGSAEPANVGESSFGNREFSLNEEENDGSDEHGDEELSSSEFDLFGHNENEEFARNDNEESSQEFGHDENEDYSRDFDRTEHDEFGQDKTTEPFPADNESLSLSLARVDLESGVTVGSSSLARQANTDDTNKKSDSDYVPVRESLSSLRSALKQPQNSAHRGYGSLRSAEFNQSYELMGNLGETSSKSPTRTPCAYDEDISSHYGIDDHSFENDHNATNIFLSEDRTRREKFMAQAMMKRVSDAQHQERYSWLDKNNNPSSGNSMWDRDAAARNWRPERQHDHQMGFENGGPSSRIHDKFQRHSSFQSHFSEDPEQVMQLLRMVLQVQKQTSKSGSLYEMGPSHKPMYEYDPTYHNFEAPQDQHFGYSNDPTHLGRYASGSNYTNRCRPKKIPFSGDPTSSTHQLDPRCSHCFPKKWSYSAQLPAPPHYNPCRLHPGHSYCNCHNNAFTPPSVGSEYQPRKSQELTNYLSRERHRAAKRHFRPVARGAPFVVCNRCCNVLLLPADFLLFKKKCHQLRCGACSQILKFSLKKGSHIVGYRAKATDPPPPSLVEDYRRDGDVGNLASPISQSQTPRGDPVSSSDDYGLSNRKSCSTEEDPGSSTPVPTPLGRAFDRIIFGASYPAEDSSNELVPEPSRGRYKDRPPRHESARPSSKVTKPDVDEGDQRSTSPLHRLMGYSSPSQVIFGSRPSGLGSSTSFSSHGEQY